MSIALHSSELGEGIAEALPNNIVPSLDPGEVASGTIPSLRPDALLPIRRVRQTLPDTGDSDPGLLNTASDLAMQDGTAPVDEVLPEGVKLRGFGDIPALRQDILDRTKEAFASRFPMENDQVRVELDELDYDQKKLQFGPSDAKKALMEGGRLASPLYGSLTLVDKITNRPIEKKKVLLANVPYLSERGTFVVGGNEYSSVSQARLRAGIYARKKENGELESHIMPKPGTGPQVRLYMESDTGVYRAGIGQATIKLYPVLNALGVKDEELTKLWGPEILQANQMAYDKQALGKFYTKFMGKKVDETLPPEEKLKLLSERLNGVGLDPDVTLRTMGEASDKLSPMLLAKSAAKLLKIQRGEAQDDDRDSLANKYFMSTDDFLVDRVTRDHNRIGRNLLYKITGKRSLDPVKPGYFTPQLETLLVGNSLSQPISGINPMELRDQLFRVVQSGEGGIGDPDSTTLSGHSADTEVLTSKGWIPWPQAKRTHKFACNIDGRLEFHSATAIHSGHYEGPMHQFEGRRVAYLVTPNHLFVTKAIWRKGLWERRQGEELSRGGHTHIYALEPYLGGKFVDQIEIPPASLKNPKHGPTSMRTVSQFFDSLLWAELLGYYMSEGSYVFNEDKSSYCFQLSKSKIANPEEWDLMAGILNKLGLKFCYTQHGRHFAVGRKHFAQYFRQFGHATDKFVPDFIMNGDIRLRRAFFDAATTMDCQNRSKESFRYSSASIRLAEQVSWLAISLGYSVTYREHVREGENTIYRVTIRTQNTACTKSKTTGGKHSVVPYSGTVYSASVPGGMLLTRRHGNILWSGNCSDVHPSRAVFCDSIAEKDSTTIGNAFHLSRIIKQGSEGRVYAPFRHRKIGKTQWLRPGQSRDTYQTGSRPSKLPKQPRTAPSAQRADRRFAVPTRRAGISLVPPYAVSTERGILPDSPEP